MNNGTCSIDGCEKQAHCRSWCPMHYQRWRLYGDLNFVQPNCGNGKPRSIGVKPCSIEGCEKVQKARGWCNPHWKRWKRYGSPTARLPGQVVNGKRICPGCKADKPLSDYTPNTAGRCKRCLADARHEWRQANPDFIPYPVSRDVARAATKAWQLRNPDKTRAYSAARRARKVNATVEPFAPTEVFERDEWICGLCGIGIDRSLRHPNRMSVSLDHVIPLSLGGEHSRANTQAAHLICNIKKGNRAA